jgi:Spy/CpxP family protein refolding chaperone
MNPLKYILVAVLGMAAVAASAQPPPGAPGGPPRGGPGFGGPPDIDRLAILLDLDPYQKNQVQAVLTAQRDAVKAERQQQRASGQRPSFEEMRAKRQANEDAIVGQLRNVLSDSQITKLKVLMEPPHGGRGPHNGPPGSTPNATPSDVPAK